MKRGVTIEQCQQIFLFFNVVEMSIILIGSVQSEFDFAKNDFAVLH